VPVAGYIPDVESETPSVKQRLEPGDRLRRDLLSPQSHQILLPGGTVLTAGFINKIAALGLAEEALRCVVSDYDAKRQAAADAERGMPFEYALYVEGKETVRLLLEGAARPRLGSLDREVLWEQASTFATKLLDRIESQPLSEFPDLRVYDLYMHSHPLNSAVLAILVGTALDYQRAQLHELALAALFADLGKARLPAVLLFKPDRLSEAELQWARTHVGGSVEFAEQFRWTQGTIRIAAAAHHERWDGSGYPRGLARRTISEAASIIGLVDAYDAMISDVPYRKRLEPAIAYRLVSAADHFDPAVVEAFKRRVVPYPTGTSVKLSTGVEAKVVAATADNPYRPVVEISGQRLDLADDGAVRVVSHLIPRRFIRQKVTFDVHVTDPGGLAIVGKAMDLSLGGLCIEADTAPQLGADLYVRLVGAGRELVLIGHVLWVRHGEGGKSVFALSAIPAGEEDRESLMSVLLDAAGIAP